jgi:hypothetical protein
VKKGDPIELKPREVADLSEMAAKRQTVLNIEWSSKRKAFLIDPPRWAEQALVKMRTLEHQPALKVDCPSCRAKAGQWCCLGTRFVENFLHDKRRFKAWEQENGRSIHSK